MTTRARTRNRRRALVLFLVGVMVLTIGSFALADSGTQQTSITPGQVGSSGAALNLVTDAITFTRPNGNAALNAGLQAAHVELVAGTAAQLKLDTAWLNPNDAAQVLNNPNAQIWVGLYHPINTGTCTPSNPSLEDTQATMTYSSTQYCVALDTAATGTLVTAGKLLLTRTMISGFLKASVSDPSTPVACTGSPVAWCQPSGAPSGSNVIFVGLTIVTPAGKPAGQQNNLNDLRFFFGGKLL